MYLSEPPTLGETPKLVHRRKATTQGAALLGAPVFDFAGCAPCPLPTAAQCRTAVRQAIVRAVGVAAGAADKVDAAVAVAPGDRTADAARTATIFRRFFGHDPSRPVPRAGRASGTAPPSPSVRRPNRTEAAAAAAAGCRRPPRPSSAPLPLRASASVSASVSASAGPRVPEATTRVTGGWSNWAVASRLAASEEVHPSHFPRP